MNADNMRDVFSPALMRRLIFLVPLVSSMLLTAPVQARMIKSTPVTCMFFRGEKLELKQTCIYESVSWTGGGGSSLTWEDGVKTKIEWGLVGRGEKVCKSNDEVRVDGVCGRSYYRDPATMKQISKQERERRMMNNQKAMYCTQLQGKSICHIW